MPFMHGPGKHGLADKSFNHPLILDDRGSQAVLFAELQNDSGGHTLVYRVRTTEAELCLSELVAYLFHVSLEDRSNQPRRAEVVTVVLIGLGAHGVREQEPRRGERRSPDATIYDHVGFCFSSVRVCSDQLLGHFPPAALVQDPALLGDFVQDPISPFTFSYRSGLEPQR
jgi:hypothetical protein